MSLHPGSIPNSSYLLLAVGPLGMHFDTDTLLASFQLSGFYISYFFVDHKQLLCAPRLSALVSLLWEEDLHPAIHL